MPARNYKAKSCLALNNSAIWLVNTKPQNKQTHCQISPRRVCKPCGYTMKTREGFLRKNIVAVSFFQNCATHPYSTYIPCPLNEIIQA